MIPLCRYVKLFHPSTYPPIWVKPRLFGRIVKKGDVLEDGCVVGMCIPERPPTAKDEDSRCIIWSTTEIEYGRLVKYSIEKLSKNYKIVLDYGDTKDTYIYPIKVWDVIQTTIIDGFQSGKMKQQGGIFYGPPGVGKSSATRIISEILGLTTIDFTPSNVLSMYVGKTEERTAQLFNRAEMLEPSLIIMDDAEWALTSRAMLVSSFTSGSSVYLGLINIILNRIEKWYRERRKCMVIATTNAPKDKIDPALQRGGRLGKPIYIPLPDAEGVEELLKAYGVGDSDARAWSTKIVNAGLSMADATNIAKDLIQGREPIIEPQHGVSYRRFVPHELGAMGNKLITALIQITELDKVVQTRKKWMYWIPYPDSISIPISSFLFGWKLKQPVLYLVDYRGVDEVIDASTSVDGVISVPHDLIPQDVLSLLMMKCERLVLCGVGQPKHTAVPKISIPQYGLLSTERNLGIGEIVASYYGVKLTEKDLNIIKNSSFERLLKALEISASHGLSFEDAWRMSGV